MNYFEAEQIIGDYIQDCIIYGDKVIIHPKVKEAYLYVTAVELYGYLKAKGLPISKELKEYLDERDQK